MNTNSSIKHVSILTLVFTFLSFVTYNKSLQQEIKYKNYLNQKYGFSVDYPYEILTPQGESGSGDGQIFKSKKIPDNSLSVYRDYLDNLDPDVKFTLEIGFNKEVKACNQKDSKRKITYKKLDKNFYVISGHKQNGDIFYQKTIFVDENLCTCILEYKEADKAIFNKISERVFKSFK